MYDFRPERRCVDVLSHEWLLTVDRILLAVEAAFGCGTHKFVIDTHADICSGHLAFGHLGVDKALAVGMLYRNCHHQRSTASVLRHLAGTVGVALHKGHKTGGCKRRVFNRRTFRTYMAEVVTYTTAALHQLYLFFVDADYTAI